MVSTNGSARHEVRILTPNAMLGYGYVAEHFWYGVKTYKPDAIIVDSGSTDGGPYKLGLGKMTCSKESYVRDMGHMLDACFHHGCKIIVGSAGGSGSDKHVDGLVDIVKEISAQRGYSFKIATIKSGIDRDLIRSKLAAGQIRPCGPVEELVEEEITEASDIVGQMGMEPYLKALADDPDIIIAGRSYDPAPFAAYAVYHGMNAGPAWHCGKIMECGGICAVPKGRSMLATVRKGHFDLVPLNLAERCTPLSVAAHTLYEKTRPDILPGPGGELHLEKARYTQLEDGRTVRVDGAEFVPKPYEVKLEAARIVGYRTIFIGGVRDPILLDQIDQFLAAVHKYTCGLFPELAAGKPTCQLNWHVYGKNAVMGPLEPVKHTLSHEVGVLGEVTAPTQEQASAIANNARVSCLHMPYEGQLATTGNFASPLTPLEQPCGAVCRFSIYHLMAIDDPAGFPISVFNVEGSSRPDKEYGFNKVDTNPVVPSKGITYAEPFDPAPDRRLQDFAKVVRSKNSGPFEITFDVMFDSAGPYEHTRNSGVLNRELIKRLYSLTDEDVLYDGFFDAALAWKCSIVRPWPQGSIAERDTLGTAQHAPLLDVVIPGYKHKGSNGHTNGRMLSHANGHMRDIINGDYVKFKRPGNGIAVASSFGASSAPIDSVARIWAGCGLDLQALHSLNLAPITEPVLPSSYKIGHLAQASIALSTLAAATIQATRLDAKTPNSVSVDPYHAAIEFKSERFTKLDGVPPPSPWGPIGGLYKTKDGHVRVHDSFTNHREGTARLLGCAADRAQVAEKLKSWYAIDFEEASIKAELCNFALRSETEWTAHPQSAAVSNFPVDITKVSTAGPIPSEHFAQVPRPIIVRRPLAGLRVIEFSRVIAAPLAGRTLAAHGADVLWITCPRLPDLPSLDRDFARGKRTIQLDLDLDTDRQTLTQLISTADVFLQSYRPGALAAKGFGVKDVRGINPAIIYATMSAWGSRGPWAQRRGFDSLVQTVSGMNIVEAALSKDGSVARPTPCQALDHAGGYLLAFGIMAAVQRRLVEGGTFNIAVSLAGAWKWLSALGRLDNGFDCSDFVTHDDVLGYLETHPSQIGTLTAVRHSGQIAGSPPFWAQMPKPLGSDKPEWL